MPHRLTLNGRKISVETQARDRGFKPRSRYISDGSTVLLEPLAPSMDGVHYSAQCPRVSPLPGYK